MAKMNSKELRKMTKEERENKLKELYLELVKSKSAKTGSAKTKNIRRLIARLITLNK